MTHNPEQLDYSPDLQAAIAAGYISLNQFVENPKTQQMSAEIEADRMKIVEGQPWGD